MFLCMFCLHVLLCCCFFIFYMNDLLNHLLKKIIFRAPVSFMKYLWKLRDNYCHVSYIINCDNMECLFNSL